MVWGEAYRELATTAAQVFKDHGTLPVVECWGDDVPEGKLTSFTMADPRLNTDPAAMPFDGQRMIFGGFEMIIDA